MGFEPFIIPKRQTSDPAPQGNQGNREDRVIALAKLLHSRGLTSSMTDAKRLAEGMVDVERKVMKQESKMVAEQTKPIQRPDIATTEQHAAQKQTMQLNLPPQFSEFVAKAAKLAHDTPQQAYTPKPAPTSTPVPPQAMSFGREEQTPIAEVPHYRRQSQQFYDEAPDWTKLRGYKGPAPKTADFPSQKIDFSQVREAAMKKLEDTTPQPSVTRVETGEGAVKVTIAENTPNVEIVQETMIIEEEPAAQPEPSQEKPAPEQPAQEKATEKKQAPESIDLFDFFKKKS